MHYVKFFFIKINANKDVIKKIRIWARVFGTGPGPGLPLLLTTDITDLYSYLRIVLPQVQDNNHFTKEK